MANMNISQFKGAIDGKMRPNRYQISGEIGPFGTVEGLLVKAASYPAASLGIIQLPYRGRIAKIPGDRVYPEWTFSIYDEKELDLRSKFEEWNKSFNDHITNLAQNQGGNFNNGTDFPNWTVSLLDTDGEIVRTIRLHTCWPVEVGAIDLTYDAADTLTEYTVTLAFDYLETQASPTSTSGGQS